MDQLDGLFTHAAHTAAGFRGAVADRPVADPVETDALRKGFGGPLPEHPQDPREVIDDLIAAAAGGIVGTAGPRFFGFVIGGALPAATAADILATGWDQPAFSAILSPAASAAEHVAGDWLKELLGIPAGASCGFVTGAQEANTVGLAAARLHVLAEAGWDVQRRGLAGAPAVRVVGSEERHATIDRAVRLLGLGDANIESVAADSNGAIDTDDLRAVLASGPAAPTIVCLQAGNVNTGACDDLRTACGIVHEYGGWAHLDGAFGLWGAANPATRGLLDGVELADSWGCDGHKWLNVPYDSAFAFCSRPAVHAEAASYTASYLVGPGGSGGPQMADLTLQSSRRARGFAVWAALRELGRSGVASMIERCCSHARRFADGLAGGGLEIVNDVVLNQVMVGFGDDSRTDEIIEAIQRDGTCWMGGTTWRGRRLMRISVSNWSTTEDDVDRSVAAVLRIAAEHRS